MNVNNPERSGSPRILGKEFLIVLVVICSSLSFTAGYFAGRNNPVQMPETVTRVADMPAAQSRPEGPQPLQPQASGQPREAAPQPVQRAAEMPPEKAVVVPKEAANQTADQRGKAQPQGNGESGGDIRKAVTSEGEIYTVQLAALKNPAEARRLKEKMTKKGLVVQIIVAKNKKNEKIYKIRTGEFREKKDADILALKLKKNEGLNTFVSLKNE